MWNYRTVLSVWSYIFLMYVMSPKGRSQRQLTYWFFGGEDICKMFWRVAVGFGWFEQMGQLNRLSGIFDRQATYFLENPLGLGMHIKNVKGNTVFFFFRKFTRNIFGDYLTCKKIWIFLMDFGVIKLPPATLFTTKSVQNGDNHGELFGSQCADEEDLCNVLSIIE